MYPKKIVYQSWKLMVAEMDFCELNLQDQNVGKTYDRFTEHVQNSINEAINGKAVYLDNLHEGSHDPLPENWWDVAIGIYDGKKVLPILAQEDAENSSLYIIDEEDEKENEAKSPAEILYDSVGCTKDAVYDSLLPVYTAIKESYDSRFKLFSWIFDHARYTAERDSMKALSGLIQALTGDSKKEVDRRYKALKNEVKMNSDERKILENKIKIDRLKLTDPTKAAKLEAEANKIRDNKKLAENKKLIEESEIDGFGFKFDIDNMNVHIDEKDGLAIEGENNNKEHKDLGDNRESMKNDADFLKDVSDDVNENDVSIPIDEGDELNKSIFSRGNEY